MDEAVTRAMALIAEPKAHSVFTPNPEIVWESRKSEELYKALSNADITLPDGVGIIMGAKILGTPLKSKVAGVEFGMGLMRELEKAGIGVFFLGGKPGVAEKAAERLKSEMPLLDVRGTNDGYFNDNVEPVLDKIKASGAEVVFVCLGAPKEQFWIANYGGKTGARLLIGLGGSIDIYAGNLQRAPDIWIKLGLEWLYRLIQEPRRIKRMSVLPVYLLAVMIEALFGKRKKAT